MEGLHAPCHPSQGSCAIVGHMPSCCLRPAVFPWLILRHTAIPSAVHAFSAPSSSISPSSCPVLQLRGHLPMAGAGRGEAEAHFAFISGAGRQHQQGQGLGVPVPLAPATQSCISPWGLGPAGAMCALAAQLGEISRIWQRRARGQTCFFFF